MTVYFRLFAGFTSFISKRCLSHFSVERARRDLRVQLHYLSNPAEQYAERHERESEPHEHRDRERDAGAAADVVESRRSRSVRTELHAP